MLSSLMLHNLKSKQPLAEWSHSGMLQKPMLREIGRHARSPHTGCPVATSLEQAAHDGLDIEALEVDVGLAAAHEHDGRAAACTPCDSAAPTCMRAHALGSVD